MSTKNITRKSPSKNDHQQQADWQSPLKQLAARLSITAFNDRGRKFDPMVIPTTVENIGEGFKKDYKLARTLFFAEYDGLPEKALSDAGVELWLACHCLFYMIRLEIDSSWRPTPSDEDEGDIKSLAIIYGLGKTLFSYGYQPEVENGIEVRSLSLVILTLHLFGLADEAALEGRSADAFDWLRQALETQDIGSRFAGEASGIRFGKLLRRSEQASLAGKSRWDQSLGAQDKAHVLTLWNAWQSSPPKYRGNAEFSRSAINECAVIEDTKTIERWCREWRLSGDQTSLLMLEPPNHLTE